VKDIVLCASLAKQVAQDPFHACPFCAMSCKTGDDIPAHSPSGKGLPSLLHIVLMDATVTLGKHHRECAKVLSLVDHNGVIHSYAGAANDDVLNFTNGRLPPEFMELLKNFVDWVGGCSAHAKCARCVRTHARGCVSHFSRGRTEASTLKLFDRFCVHALFCRHGIIPLNGVAHSSTPGALLPPCPDLVPAYTTARGDQLLHYPAQIPDADARHCVC